MLVKCNIHVIKVEDIFGDDILGSIFLTKYVRILIQVSLKLVLKLSTSWQLVGIDPGNGLAQKRLQTLVLANDGPIHRHVSYTFHDDVIKWTPLPRS